MNIQMQLLPLLLLILLLQSLNLIPVLQFKIPQQVQILIFRMRRIRRRSGLVGQDRGERVHAITLPDSRARGRSAGA